jgi:GNAT superfamily N-acetyltransferase
MTSIFMNNDIKHRKATIEDLTKIIELLFDDDLGHKRESKEIDLNEHYIEAFHKISCDPNQYLMVVEYEREIIGTCHLTIMHSLTFSGSTRLQIEAVRIHSNYRGRKIGQWMFNEAIKYGKSVGASIIQLATNKKRISAINFYKKLGFEASHEGMKLNLNKLT